MMTGMAQWNNVGSLCYFIVASIVGTCVMAAVSALSGQHLSSSQHLSHQRSDDIRQLYIDTLKKSVTGILLQTEGYKADTTAGLSDLQKLPFDLDKRTNGLDFPVHVSKAFFLSLLLARPRHRQPTGNRNHVFVRCTSTL